ncbi:hypothetical protein [Prescottella equi]|uniref:hypothetical protein n=1 Tax=Rhodococcus hoagii TaxID=43767 RepID=UPI000A5F0CBE|nr:hypothetical protein [Prescottella equi]
MTTTVNHSPSTDHRHVTAVMYTGLALTVIATVAPYIADSVLAEHIRSGYPTYSPAEIDSAVTAYLVILTVVGVLGITGWIGTTWAVKAGKPWARWVAAAMFVIGTLVALAGLLVQDTSGDTGLAPLLGWIGMAPSLAGLTAVVMLWRRS